MLLFRECDYSASVKVTSMSTPQCMFPQQNDGLEQYETCFCPSVVRVLHLVSVSFKSINILNVTMPVEKTLIPVY